MTAYGFTLQLEVAVPAAEGWFDRFVEAVYLHAPDSTPYMRGGVAYLGFDREAVTLREAVTSAIESVRRADQRVTVVGVILDDGQPIAPLLAAAS